MEGKLRAYMDSLFQEVPPTVKASELKEEMLLNMTDKYRDLLATGMDEQTAYNSVISSIGDIGELFETLTDSETEQPEMIDKAKKRSALLTAIAVGLYILSPVPVVLLGGEKSVIGIVLLFVMVALATGLLVFNNMTRPQYVAKTDDMVEEFREWSSGKKHEKEARSAVSLALWTLTAAIYFIVSFSTGAWGITWIIFLVAAPIDALISLLFSVKYGKGK